MCWSFHYDGHTFYCLASSMSGQDEPNAALWLATQAGEMAPSCPLGITRCVPQLKIVFFFLVINPLLTKLRFGGHGRILVSSLFLHVYGP